MTLGVRKKKLMGVAAVALLALSASGCSSLPTVPDWVDPTTWFGGEEATPDDGQTPDLANVPDKPGAAASDEQQKVAESLSSDRANAKYSADALRGGTEPAAAPPPDVAPAPAAEVKPVAAPKPAAPPPPPPAQVAAVDRSVSQDPMGNAAAGTLPDTQGGVPAAAIAATPRSSDVVKTADLPEAAAPVKPVSKPAAKKHKPVKVAEAAPAAPIAAPPAEAEPAPVAPVAPPVTHVAKAPKIAKAAPPIRTAEPAPAPVPTVAPGDAELGFQPSSAPPLDASVSQFVAAPIVDHYRSTAAQSGMRSGGSAYASAYARKKHHPKANAEAAVGGPEKMEGKVVANLDTLGAAPVAQPNVAANVNGAAAVVMFPGDTVNLNASARAQIREAVAQFQAAGGQGYVRVVGHSSSRTANMSAEAHLAVIFKKSQARANAVARELIRAGVPADRVLVEAVGDTQPVYYESMPKGEDGNRRAEIFLQG